MQIISILKQQVQKAVKDLYGIEVPPSDITINETKPEFEGDYTVVMFAFVKQLRKAPDALCNEMGQWMLENTKDITTAYNVIKGFLNITISDSFWIDFLKQNNTEHFGQQPENGQKLMVEYASPNTNKPLHLGHLRNIFLGWSIAEIYKANGWNVIKTCIVNDRGIHICKSMLAWQKFANGATPQSTGIKGDHLVGDYYVLFENELKNQAAILLQKLLNSQMPAGMDDIAATKAQQLAEKLSSENLPPEKLAEIKSELTEIARNASPLMTEVREMLLKWEQGNEEIMVLWRMMNGWVYEGFDVTYKRIGADFKKTYYESQTYLLGKDLVENGLKQKVFTQKADGSVWIDLTDDGLDEKLVLRKDGTSVYITQDIGLAEKKYEDYAMQSSIYVIADEQNYHMKVLQLICSKLQMPFASSIYHLSYGMVELPSGRMKSREGTVVDADDICNEMETVAAQKTEELGKVKDFTLDELEQLYKTLGLGALKFYLLRVDPKKKMVFNPEDSIDFQGFTGTFIQFTHARIKAILRKNETPLNHEFVETTLLPLEKRLLVLLEQYPAIIAQACAEMNPSVVANYMFLVAKSFNSFITELRVLQAESETKKQLRLNLSQFTAHIIKHGMGLLGIAVPERM